MSSEPPLHVVLGAGQIGSRLSRLLASRGYRVRVVRQRAVRGPDPRIEHLGGDLADLQFAERAAAGASVVYDCINPPYHRWAELLLPMGRGTLHGAAKAGARLVALDNLYMYGKPSGPLTEESPVAPCSKKGALRAELAALRLAAHRRGDVAVAIGRASDYFGSDLQNSLWSDRFFDRIFAGKPGECTGDPDQPHAYTYADDAARGLATLGERDEAPGQVWHLPTPPAESTQAVARRLGAALGLEVRVARVPPLLLKVAGLFSPLLRELPEMAYQWEAPFVLDDSKFRRAFGWSATPFDESVPVVAKWARSRYASPRAAAAPAR